MKKILFIVSIMFACVLSSKAEVIQRDTVAYTGDYELLTKEKTNDFGEVSVSYYVVLKDFKNKKVSVNKATYKSGKITHIIYNKDAEGNRKIGKAINKEIQGK